MTTTVFVANGGIASRGSGKPRFAAGNGAAQSTA
jgi:hypothetical protein